MLLLDVKCLGVARHVRVFEEVASELLVTIFLESDANDFNLVVILRVLCTNIAILNNFHSGFRLVPSPLSPWNSYTHHIADSDRLPISNLTLPSIIDNSAKYNLIPLPKFSFNHFLYIYLLFNFRLFFLDQNVLSGGIIQLVVSSVFVDWFYTLGLHGVEDHTCETVKLEVYFAEVN